MKTGCRIRLEDLSIGLVILRFRDGNDTMHFKSVYFHFRSKYSGSKKVRRLRIRALSSCGKDERDRRYGTDGVSASASAVFPPSHISIQIIRRRTAMRTDIYPSYNICVLSARVLLKNGFVSNRIRTIPQSGPAVKQKVSAAENYVCFSSRKNRTGNK